MKRRLSDYAHLLLFAGAIVLLDQVSKYLIRANLAPGEVYRPELWISQYARFVHLHNRGAAIGIFPSLGNVFMLLAMLVCVAILYYYPRIPRQDRLLRLSMAFLLGGALGNLIDRLHQGFVTDFISFLNIPVFNIADLCIPIGVTLLIIGLWRQERNMGLRQASVERGEDSGDGGQTGRNLTSKPSIEDIRSE